MTQMSAPRSRLEKQPTAPSIIYLLFRAQNTGYAPRALNVLARCYGEGFNAFMSDHIYKKIELVGSSQNGIEDAVNNAISRAGKTIRNMNWFEVSEVRGHIVR